MRSQTRRLVMCLFALAGAPDVWAQEAAATGTIRGAVVDARDGTGLERVSVRLQDTGQTTLTGNDGRFEMTNVTPGSHELYISAVDFILVKRTVNVTAGSVLELTIPITEGTGTYTETVTVVGSAIPQADSTVAAQQVLGSNDLQQLRGLITNDPFRAIQALPGVASADDLRSEFTVRGVAIDHMSFTFEGISTPLLVHTVQGVQDGGSVAMVNGDVLQEISLSNGSYPQRFGNRTGAELDFRMREGSRDGFTGHVGVSMADASFVMEGPIGRARRGSWLASARKSYLEMVIKRLDPENDFGFGFTDLQSKLVYDINPRHQLQLAMTAGHSRLDQQPDQLGIDDVQDGRNAASVAVLTWRYASSTRFILTQKVASAANTFRNLNLNGMELERGKTWDLLYRTDSSYAVTPRVMLQGGWEARRSAASRIEQGLRIYGPRFDVSEDFSDSAVAMSAYGMANLTVGRGVLVPGMRVDRWTLTGHTTASPWLEGNWPISGSLNVRAGGGIYRQEPSFTEVSGRRGQMNLRTERAYHADAGLEGRLGRTTKWQATVYTREDRDLLRLPDSEVKLVNGALVFPSVTSRYENALDGHSRGIELLLQRRSPNGLSGWLAYDLSFTRYHDQSTGERFWGDFDQRHTLSAYTSYRLNDRMSFSVRFRAGSNFPAPGYWEARGGAHFVSDTRNGVRVPAYSRLDLRANRTFTWQQKRLTLFVEALNAYNRANVRPASPGINVRTFQTFGLFDTMFPLVPAAGFLLEF